MGFANKFLMVVTGVLILNSCSRATEHEEVHIESSTLLKVSKTSGENFLDTVNTDNIKLFYKKDGNLVLISDNSDYPKGYIIVNEQHVNQKMIKIFCYINGTNNSEETFIKWNDLDIDTLSYNITRNGIGVSISSVKYNDTPISNSNVNGIYEIIKE